MLSFSGSSRSRTILLLKVAYRSEVFVIVLKSFSFVGQGDEEGEDIEDQMDTLEETTPEAELPEDSLEGEEKENEQNKVTRANPTDTMLK